MPTAFCARGKSKTAAADACTNGDVAWGEEFGGHGDCCAAEVDEGEIGRCESGWLKGLWMVMVEVRSRGGSSLVCVESSEGVCLEQVCLTIRQGAFP